MSNIVQTELVNLVSAWTGQGYTAPTLPLTLALSTATTTSTSAGTEVSGGSYGRKTITFGTPSSATPSVASNSAAVTYTAMPAAAVTDINIYDSAGTPARKGFGALTTPKTVASGDTLSFAIAAVTTQIG